MRTTVCAVVFGCLVCVGPAGADDIRTIRAALATAQLADLGVTMYGFSLGHREVHPALAWSDDHPAAFVAVKAIGCLFVDWQIRRLATRHRRAAKIVGVVLTGAYVGIVGRNLWALERGRGQR